MNGITTIIAWIILEILSGMVDYAFFLVFFWDKLQHDYQIRFSRMVATITIVFL